MWSTKLQRTSSENDDARVIYTANAAYSSAVTSSLVFEPSMSSILEHIFLKKLCLRIVSIIGVDANKCVDQICLKVNLTRVLDSMNFPHL